MEERTVRVLRKEAIRGILYQICQSEHTNHTPDTAQRPMGFVLVCLPRLVDSY